MSTTHWKTLSNTDYIGAYALQPGEERTVTIKSVTRKEVTSNGGKKQDCIVVQLVGEKPLILNATNAKSIHRLYGPYIEDWAGKMVTLYASTTSLAGEVVECIRIRPTVGPPKKKPITDAQFDKALVSVANQAFTVDQILTRFELTEAQLAKLPKQIEGATE